MMYEFIKTDIDGAYLIKYHKYEDQRGVYEKNFEYNVFKKYSINFTITESSEIYTKKGAIRGLHFQTGESQAKLVRVVKGKVFDVIVDLRKGSFSYGKAFSVVLDDKSNTTLYIPKGFAHGFLTLEDSIFAYHSDGKYEPDKAGGLLWNDISLDIEWPLDEIGGVENIICSKKDEKLPTLKEWRKIQ